MSLPCPICHSTKEEKHSLSADNECYLCVGHAITDGEIYVDCLKNLNPQTIKNILLSDSQVPKGVTYVFVE